MPLINSAWTTGFLQEVMRWKSQMYYENGMNEEFFVVVVVSADEDPRVETS